jgi:hypothetical protein
MRSAELILKHPLTVSWLSTLGGVLDLHFRSTSPYAMDSPRVCVVRCAAVQQASPTPISSCLVEERRGMKRAMLEVVAAGVVATSDDVERYLKCRCVPSSTALHAGALWLSCFC